MSKFFATFKDCGTCVESGYGWCPVRRKCGGFANKECGLGEAYVAEGAPRKAAPQRARKPSSGGTRQPAGNDMSAIFAKFRDCSSCVGAGYGWCTIQRKCGGFANKECGIGPRYVSAEPAPRNGLWEPKHKRKAAEEAATADVPAAPRRLRRASSMPGPPRRRRLRTSRRSRSRRWGRRCRWEARATAPAASVLAPTSCARSRTSRSCRGSSSSRRRWRQAAHPRRRERGRCGRTRRRPVRGG